MVSRNVKGRQAVKALRGTTLLLAGEIEEVPDGSRVDTISAMGLCWR